MSNKRKIILFGLVFFGGFANLATEIIGPRMFASLFGNTTTVWAIIISVTLIGISTGYYLGGHIPHNHNIPILSSLLLINCCWLLIISWITTKIPILTTGLNSTLSIMITAVSAFFIPSMLFGMISPLAISELSKNKTPQQISKIVGNIYGTSTVGSVLGALSAGLYLIPWIGLSTSFRFFAAGLGIFAAYFLGEWKKLIGAAAIAICVFFPMPTNIQKNDLVVLAHTEGYFQTIHISTDNKNFVRMNLDGTYDAEMDLHTKEPRIQYSIDMVNLAGDVAGKNVLVIGGAGHTQARALENRGATITEIEIDPIIVKLSDEHFGPLEGTMVIGDGRAFLQQAPPNSYDVILIDAYGSRSIPPQLTTREFFQTVEQALKPNGKMIYNLISIPSGEKSDSFRALSATISSVFSDTRVTTINGYEPKNTLFIASMQVMKESQYSIAPINGTLLTDDLNPIDLLNEKILQ